ncbi:uncharacterized protein LOC129755719 [Uranotaenia lowii]|uniref:uncharacterized protein LOC129755719 n=1 Tax=Uranotaenia lowii TaxID=190385 RepID=UPI00247892EA|nr:uncharacterized protein LOC129755719 [Uranotaenia lowii]XP_055608318.1 uncharacterized protein LOC129755719 [Uranotaenia lowii]
MLKPLVLPSRNFKKNNYNVLTPQLAPNSDRSPSASSVRVTPPPFDTTLRWLRSKLQRSAVLVIRWRRRRQGFSLLIHLLTIITLFLSGNGVLLCSGAAAPTPVAKGTIPTAFGVRSGHPRIAESTRIANLTRQHSGDLFYTFDNEKCDTDTCVGLSSGTANLWISSGSNGQNAIIGSEISSVSPIECKCQCLSHLTTYREDLGICVDDVRECTLAPFMSGLTLEKIPFVFLPHRGQIVYPSKEIGFPGVKMPMCAVSGSQYLTHTGWAELRNPIDTDVPFRLFRDEGRIYLQWLGEPDLRQRMQGRLILVHLMCRDMSPRLILKDGRTRTLDDVLPNQNIFTPCIAFRVVGTPIKYVNNVTEVSFSSETHVDNQSGMSTKEYVVIAICSLCLGLIYIASVFLYIHMKKRKRNSSDDDDGNTIKNEYSSYQQNDQVTFGVGLGSQVGAFGGQTRNSFIGRGNIQRQSGTAPVGHRGLSSSLNVGIHAEEMGIVKNNPLLKHFPNLSDNSGFISDNSNSVSEFEDERILDAEKMMQTTVNVHQPKNYLGHTDMDGGHHQQQLLGQQHPNSHQNLDGLNNPNGQDTECLPEENVSIVEDINNDEKLENMKSIVNGTMRRKLYFNPAYFEPHLLVTPPPAAIEFLNKIREVITIAKYKMSAKRFQPSLNIIPEELQQTQGSETYAAAHTAPPSRRSSLISSKKDSSKKSICSGCPGCEKKGNSDLVVPSSNCKNCGDKQNSIRKWLEEVSSNHGENAGGESDTYDGVKAHSLNNFAENSESLKSLDDRSTYESLPINPDAKTQPKSLRSRHGSDSSSASDNETIIASSVKERGSVTRTPSRSKSIRSDSSSAPKIVSHSLKSDVMKLAKFSNDDGSLMKNNNFIYDRAASESHAKKQEIYMRNINNSLVNLDSNKVYDKRDIYNITGNELYNNPQFESSPRMHHRAFNPNQRHHHHSHGRKQLVPHMAPGVSAKRHFEVQDQFSNRSYPKMRNINHMPDMVYEAMAIDQRHNTWRSRHDPPPIHESYLYEQNDSRYNSIDRTEKYRNEKFFHDFINSDDSNTLGNRSGKNSFNKYQPDSPIYSRKSPHYLIVDYETDSLERVTSKTQNSFNTSTTNSSDLSSQPSPSHSTALPLEEEVEIRNAIYDRVEGFRKDIDTIKTEREAASLEQDDYEDMPMNSLAETVIQVPSKKGPKIKCDTPFQGSITIEVEHSPDDCELSTDSDQFEPDTLDRKPKKNSNIVGRHRSNVWAQDRLSSKETNLTSLPADLNNHFVLKNSQSFRETSFGSLREIYESRNLKNFNQNQMHSLEEFDVTSGKLLSLELRHSKRQRSNVLCTETPKLMPPDLIPPDVSAMKNLYDHPRQHLKKVEDYGISPKNLACWNNDKFMKQPNGPAPKPSFSKIDKYESIKNLATDSDSSKVTGLSDGEHKSPNNQKKIANYSQVNKPSRDRTPSVEREGFRLKSEPSSLVDDYTSVSEMKEFDFLDQTDESIYDLNGKSQSIANRAKFIEDIDKIEVLSTKTLSNYDYPVQSNDLSNINPKENESDKSSFEINPITTTKVYRVEISPPSNGMQIAMGLRDRVKKSKDIKNAWKKFIGIAASKFNGKSDSDNEKNSESSDTLEKDEGISSLIDDTSGAYDCSDKAAHHHHRRHHHHRKSPPSSSGGPPVVNRQITVIRSNSRSSAKDDSGYMSADSSESRLNSKKKYERFNFTAKSIDSSDSIQEENKYEICALPENTGTGKSDTSTASSEGSSRSEKLLARPKAPPPPLPPPNPPPPPPPTTTIPTKKSPNIPYKSRIGKPQTKPPPPPPSHPAPKIPRPEENFLFNTADSISVRVYSSDDENVASSDNVSCVSDNNNEDDEDDGTSCATDDVCESGAESVETHSVFFKNIRRRPAETCNIAALAH